MELEMSRLRAHVERLSLSASSPSEQIAALEEKLARAEKAAALAQRELGDLKRNLERMADKAVKAGSAQASAETKVRSLEKEVEGLQSEKEELSKKAEGLEKKVATLTTLHKEQDGRMQALRKEKEGRDKQIEELISRVEKLEGENLKLRKKDAADGGGDDDGVDELEDEERLRLQKRLRELEAENTDLRRGIWHEKRKELQVGPDDAGRFTDVDLGASPVAHRRKSAAGGGGGGIGDFLQSGLNALTGVGAGEEHHDLLEEDDMDFDEDAFRRAAEAEAKNRIERIKEIKRGLKNWEGWRLDLVENRRGGGEGIGEIFEI
jgi:chromosome segregation ATPase